MQLIRTSLLSALGIVVAAQGAVLGAAPASSAAPDPSPRQRAITPLQAIPADSVVDSYGVGIHLNFLDTPYRDADAVADALSDLGVRHVRDDLFLGSPWQYAAIRTVADEGIGFDLIMGRPGTEASPTDYVDTVANQLPAHAVESLEGVNEWDLFGPDDAETWVPQMKSWQQRLYAAANANPATAGLPVLSPALAFRQNYTTAGDLSQDADIANAHMYPGGYRPSNEIDAITRAVRASIPDRATPQVTTEAGYHNALGTDPVRHLPVPEDVAGVYMPRMLLEHVARGEQRMYGYELIDEFDDPGLADPEAHFGLLRHDLTPKPAYTAMKSLLGLLADPGPSFTPGSLPIDADDFPSDARYLLTQKRDGRFVLLLWRDVNVYDPVTQEQVPVAPEPVNVRLAQPAGMTVFRPSDGAAPVADYARSSLSLELGGQVTAIVIDPSRPPEPTNVTAKRGDARATVTWDLPPSPVHVTGFEVTRRPGGEVQSVAAGARSYRDTGLTNGTRYTYGVRTLTSDKSSPAVTASVSPATVPTSPGIGSAKAGKRRVTVAWSRASPRGRPVTAYRLSCLGKAVKVGRTTYRATVTGLAASKRLRCGVQAHNGVGWSATAYTRYVTTKR
jgi:hypothetical protein